MSAELTPQQALAIYSLVFATTEEARRPFSSKLEPLKAPAVKDLIQRGFLHAEPAKPQGKRVSLTDKGWAWAAEHLQTVELSKARATVNTLQFVLARLGEHLAANGGTLAGFIQPSVNGASTRLEPAAPAPPQPVSPARAEPAAPASADLPTRIRATCLDLGRGSSRTRVRLRELRARLPDVPKERLDRELVELQNAGTLVLYRIDDPTDIQPEDERAALHVAGAPRHILYLEH